MMRPGYRKFGTTADVGVVSFGRELGEAFAEQAAGMFSLMTDLRKVRLVKVFEVQAEGVDREGLLVAWLNELLYLRDTQGFLGKRFELRSLPGPRLEATVYGEEFDDCRHVRKTEVKAVTYHLLAVEECPGGVRTRVVYDI